jgi:FAD/FMN-containing dehydrogenase
LRLDSGSLAKIIDYDSANQVITVGAGMSFNALQKKLQEHNQWLPLRPPFFKENSTIGRLVALAACGPERLLYGAPRDLLLGLRFINSAGDLISAGGRVVKNVAGYDITRLITGSAGTLGFITEATWRLSTMPQRCAAISAEGSLAACKAAATDVLKSNCLPVFVASMPARPQAAGSDRSLWNMVVGFEGFSETVDYQREKCSAILEKAQMKVVDQFDYPVHQGAFAGIYEQLAQSSFILRGDFLLNRVAGFLDSLNGNPALANVFLDFGCGRILAGLDDFSDEQWRRMCSLAEEHGGHVLLEKAPDDFRKANDVFGLPSPTWKVMQKIKTELDPDGTFAPGKLPGKV